jgi:hypothetical protein
LHAAEQRYRHDESLTKRTKYPLLMWHGRGRAGVTYESTPHEREGSLNN